MQSPEPIHHGSPAPDPTAPAQSASGRRAHAHLAIPPVMPTPARTEPLHSTAPASTKLAKSVAKLGTVVYTDGMQQLAGAHTLAVASGTRLVQCLVRSSHHHPHQISSLEKASEIESSGSLVLESDEMSHFDV